ncbi:MAG: hypothetical protein ACRC2H_08390, partial [Silanimonas sp.]
EGRDHRQPAGAAGVGPALPGIDWPSLAMLARLNAWAIVEVANADERPRWNPGNFSGETFAAPQRGADAASQRSSH